MISQGALLQGSDLHSANTFRFVDKTLKKKTGNMGNIQKCTFVKELRENRVYLGVKGCSRVRSRGGGEEKDVSKLAPSLLKGNAAAEADIYLLY